MTEAGIPRPLQAALLEPILESVLAPLDSALGDFGSLVTAACARAIAENE